MQRIAAPMPPMQPLAPSATSILRSSDGQMRLTQSAATAKENINPGKKDPIPRSTGSAQPLPPTSRPENANRRKRIPIQIPVIAMEDIMSPASTFTHKDTSGFLTSVNTSKA